MNTIDQARPSRASTGCSACRSACRPPTCRRSRRCSARCSPTTRPMSGSRNSSPPSISPTRSTAASSTPSSAASRPGSWPMSVTLKAEFEHSGVLEEVGGPAYLAQLLTAMVGIINAGEYGRAVHDCLAAPPADRRRRDGGQQRLRRRGRARCAQQQIEAAEQWLFDLAKDGGVDGGFVTFERALTEAVQLAAERAFTTPRRRVRPDHRPARPGCQDGRAARVGPGDPRRPAGHGQDRARHQDRLRRREGAAARGAGRRTRMRCRAAGRRSSRWK